MNLLQMKSGTPLPLRKTKTMSTTRKIDSTETIQENELSLTDIFAKPSMDVGKMSAKNNVQPLGDPQSTKSMTTWGSLSSKRVVQGFSEACNASLDSLDASVDFEELAEEPLHKTPRSTRISKFQNSLPDLVQSNLPHSDLNRSAQSLLESPVDGILDLPSRDNRGIPRQISLQEQELRTISRRPPAGPPVRKLSGSRPRLDRSQSDRNFGTSTLIPCGRTRGIGRSRSDKQELRRLVRKTSLTQPQPFSGALPRPARLSDVREQWQSTSIRSLASNEGRCIQSLQYLDPFGRWGRYSGHYNRLTGMPHGNGRLDFLEDGVSVGFYEGDWIYGEWSGHGRLVIHRETESGKKLMDIYEGEFLDNQKHGQGQLYYES